MKKRLFSIFLICCLLFTMLPTAVFATEQAETLPPERPVQYVSYLQTEIAADGVFNTGGYGSLCINEVYEEDGYTLKSLPKAALVNAAGNYLFPYKETWLRYRYNDGVVSLTASNAYEAHYCTETHEPDMPGFYNISGTELFENEYLCASPMYNGYAFVHDYDSYNGSVVGAYLIDRTGAIAYTFPESFIEGGWRGFSDWKDGFGTDKQCGWPSEGLIACTELCGIGYNGEDIYYVNGYMDMAGNTVITKDISGTTSDTYTDALPFHEGLAGVRSAETGKYGFINNSGVEIISCQYEGVSDFCDGYAAAKKDGKWGYISKDGETVIPFEYDAAYGAGSGLFAVVKDGKCGMVNVENNVIVPFEYDDISSCEGGVAYAIKDGTLVIIKAITVFSGYCGGDTTAELDAASGYNKNMKWTLTSDCTTITISGTGKMADFEFGKAPWDAAYDKITNVCIKEGVTSVGKDAFTEYPNLNTVEIAASVTSLGEYTFYNCENLTNMYFYGNAPTVQGKSITFGENVVLNCRSDKTGWTDVPAYDSVEGKWNNHKLSVWNIVDEITVAYETDISGDQELSQRLGKTKISYLMTLTNVGEKVSVSSDEYLVNHLDFVTFPDSTVKVYEDIDNDVFGEGFYLDMDQHFGEAGALEAGVAYNLFDTQDLLMGHDLDSGLNDRIHLGAGAYFASWAAFNSFLSKPTVSISTYEADKPQSQIVASGFCGGDETTGYDEVSGCYKNLEWTLDANGLLTISGTGKMANCYPDAPWASYRGSIERIIIGNGVTSIGSHAFLNCFNLTSITIPDTVTFIGNSAFYYCDKLESITLPANVAELGQTPFGHSGIKSFNVAVGNTHYKSIDGVMFSADLTKLICYPPAAEREEYVVPDSVTSIEYLAVQTKNLKKITVPKTVISLDKGAIEPIFEFVGSEEVSYCPTIYCYENSAAYNFAVENNLPYSVIAESNIVASGYCGGDTAANLIEDHGSDEYNVYDNLSWTLDNAGLLTISGTGEMTDWSNSSSVSWYSNRSSIESVVIDSGVTSIGNYALCTCNSLASVTIPDSVASIRNHAFAWCTSLTSVTIPDSVTSIGDYAFGECDSLTSVTIPESVISIGAYAFAWCNSLASVTIPDSVTSIGREAFRECDSLTSITIPNSVTRIGDYAFPACSSLLTIQVVTGNPNYCSQDGVLFNKDKTVLLQYPAGKAGSYTIPDSVTSIGDYAFGECDSLTSVTIPEGVTSISNYAFCECSSLTSVTIPEGVTNIGEWAFWNCDSLTSVMIPDSVTSIGECAFGDCSSLANITIPGNVTRIGDVAFCSCRNLTRATFEGNAPSEFGNNVFDNCADSFTIHAPKDNPTWTTDAAYDAQAQTWHGYPIVFDLELQIIASGYCGGDTTAELAQDIVIGDGVYNLYKNLSWALDSDGVLTISGTGQMAVFYQITRQIDDSWVTTSNAPWGSFREQVKKVVVGEGVTEIAASSFAGLDKLTEAVIGEDVKSIGISAFFRCARLSNVTLPVSLEKIEYRAFSGCNSLSKLNYSGNADQWNSIDIGWDNDCLLDICGFELYHVGECGDHAVWTFEDGILTISGTGAIQDDEFVWGGDGDSGYSYMPWWGYNNKIKSIVVCEGITRIGRGAFHDTIAESVSISSTVTEIEESAFPFGGAIDPEPLTTITVDENNAVFSSDSFGVLFNKAKTTLLKYPAGNTKTEYVVPSSVTRIGGGAFSSCNNLEAVTLPNNLTDIEEDAFAFCENLTELIVPSNVTSIGSGAFRDCVNLTSVIFLGDTPTVFGSEYGAKVFNYCAEGFTIHAPKNNTTWTSTAAYDAQAHTWHGYPIVFDVENTCEHAWNDGVVTTQPTHLAKGVKTFTCTKCGETRTEPVAKLAEHTYDQQIVDAKYLKSAATCTEAAVYYKSCLCGGAGTETFTYGDPAGHTYGTPSYAWDGASCTASRVCTKCSDETDGHTQTETVIGRYVKDTDATCTVCEKGHYEASFTNQAFAAQSTAKDSVDQGTPLGHSFPETWEKHDETQHKHSCTRCHTEVEYENHAWNDGVITTPATAVADGVKTFTCTKCGETKTEPVAKLAEQSIQKVPDITWTYGAQTQITVNFTNYSENGGALSYTSSNENVATVTAGQTGCTVNIVGAGETTITATAAAVSGKYVETSVSVKLTINPAPLTVTAESLSISYGSEASGFDYTVRGLVLGETAADVLSGTPEYQCAYSQYDNVGSYPISVSGLSAANYTISYQPGTLTVEKLANYTLSFDENTLLQSTNHGTPVLAMVTPQDSTAQILVEYYDGVSWKNTLPTTSGTYPVRASLTASNNLVVPQTPTYIDDSLRIIDGAFIGNKDNVIDVTENPDGTVEVGELTPEQVQAVTNEAANNDKSVTLDLTGNGVASGAKGLTIPASLVDAMNDSTNVESFTVKTQDAEIEMDSSVLNTLAGSLEEGSKLTIQMETVKQDDLTNSQKEALSSIGGGNDVVVLDLKLIAKQYDEQGTETDSNEIHRLGGVAEIKVAYDFEETDGKILVALYVDENGNTTYLPVTYKDGFVSFRTDHFSVYAVTEIDKTACGHSWDEGVVTLEPTTTSTGIKTYTCLICGETKTETIAKKSGGGDISGGEVTSYVVAVADTENGKLTVSQKNASAGQTVTITVSPDEGHKLNTLTVKDTNGNALTLTKVSDTTYTFKMPSSKVNVSATFVKIGTCQQDKTCPAAKFTDIDLTAWYHDGVHFCVEKGYMQGVSATAFNPSGTTTRAMIVTMLWRMEGKPVANYAMSFKDVKGGQWYTEAICWAQSTKIVEGYSAEKFGPDDPITREQMATILYRYAKYHEIDVANTNTLAGFTDADKVSAWALDAMKWANAVGLVQGRTTTTLVPEVSITRAEAAAMVQRYCEAFKK